ncbi:MAG: sulfite exporter TauE/SafE family protein [Desulfuromonas sp.]|nr:MAG: sulfite exporter TauE/SafE family protein [Desulfuromonas sp.]
MSETHFLLALSTGLMGSGHCIGMCGGLIAAFSLSTPGRQGGLLFQTLYHLGRITTYSLIGLAAGAMGSAIAYTDSFREISRVVLVGSDLFIIVVGLGTAGTFKALNIMRLDFPGPTRLVTSVSRKLHRLPVSLAALPLGLVMGLLPCGFLYAVAITAAQTASMLEATLVMFGFGLGTLPALILFGGTTAWMGEHARVWMLRIAGLMVAIMGILNLIQHLQLMD